MKRLFFALLAIMALSCSKFDDSEIWDKLNNHESRITELEKLCKEMNAEIIKLQTLVSAFENNDYIINASPLVTGDGYTFVFKSGKSVVIYNGKDGEDGKDGTNGTNGINGTTPQIGVKQDTDGFYYWTVNGEWLLVDGNKVRASATDGANGKNGNDGVTPTFKIEDGNWYISYDNEKTWEFLGRATGKDGLAGEDGDSLFKKVYIEDGYVCFELNDEEKTVIRIPLMKDGILSITLEKEGTLSKFISPEQARTTTSLILRGKANNDDMRFVQLMTNLQALDLSENDFYVEEGYSYKDFFLNPYKDTLINRSISEVILPKSVIPMNADISCCIALRKVTITSDDTGIASDSFCPSCDELNYAEGGTKITSGGKYRKFNRITYPSTTKYVPATLTMCVDTESEKSTSGTVTTTYNYHTIPCDILICKAVVPPVLDQSTYASSVSISYDKTNKWYYIYSKSTYSTSKRYQKINVPSHTVLYVPNESIEAYRSAPIWENFTNILPLESLEE